MKLRLSPKQIRLRLSIDELKTLSAVGFLSETIHFNPLEVFTYSLRTWNLALLEATFTSKELLVSLPVEMFLELQTRKKIMVEQIQNEGLKEEIHVIVELDMNELKKE
jgi:hypothetical protein